MLQDYFCQPRNIEIPDEYLVTDGCFHIIEWHKMVTYGRCMYTCVNNITLVPHWLLLPVLGLSHVKISNKRKHHLHVFGKACQWRLGKELGA